MLESAQNPPSWGPDKPYLFSWMNTALVRKGVKVIDMFGADTTMVIEVR